MESALRPRDIQTRIRAGESAESVAAAAQTTVEAIMPFAVPVLAERAHVAQTALTCSVRRRSSDAANVARTLGDAARVLLTDVGLRDDDVTWDSWRRDNGQWTLVADYTVGGRDRRAEFTYDVRGRYVVADNDEARMLTGETKPAADPVVPGRGAPGEPIRPVRRLSVVADQDELPLGDDAIELVRERPEPATAEPATRPEAEGTAPEVAAEAEPVVEPESEPSTDLDLETAPDAGDEPTQTSTGEDFAEAFPQTADADWLAAPADAGVDATSDASSDREVSDDTDELPFDTGVPDDEEPAAEADRQPNDEKRADETPDDQQPDEQPADEQQPPRKRAARKKGRSSVPTWDEIMFGGGDKGE